MLVPIYRQSVAQQGLPDARQSIDTSAGTFADPVALQGAETFGHALDKLSQAGLAIYDHQQFEQAQALNKTKIQDAINAHAKTLLDVQYGQQGFLNVLGGNAIKQDDQGKTLSDHALKAIDDSFNAQAQTLQTPEQIASFTAHANALNLQAQTDLQRHVLQQGRVYQTDVASSGVALEQQKIGYNYNNPDLINASSQAIGEHIAQLGQLNGWAPEVVQAKTQQALSSALRQSIDSAMQHNDFNAAYGLQKSYARHMTADDAEKSAKAVSSNYIAALADSDPSALVDATNNRSLYAIRQIESGNQDTTPDGKPLVSSDGKSLGALQTTHETANKPGYGIKPAQSMTAEEYNRVGEQKHAVLMQMYNGDLDKVHAAYNWGEGNVNNLVGQYGEDWANHLPASVKTYISKARELMQTNSPLDIATPQQIAQAHQVGLSRIDNNTSVYRANLESVVNDQLAQLEHKGKTSDLKTLDDFKLVYGDKADAKFNEYQTRLNYANDVYTLRNMSVDQMAALLDKRKPGNNASALEYKLYDSLQNDMADKAKTDTAIAKKTAEQQAQQTELSFKTAPPAGINELLNQNRPKDWTPDEIDRWNRLNNAAQKELADRAKDPMSRAIELNFDVGGAARIDNPDALVNTLAKRQAVGNEISQRLQTPFALLTNAEAEQAQDTFKVLSSNDRYTLLSKLANNNFDARTAYTAVKQVTGDNISAQMAAKMSQYPSLSETAKTLLAGNALLENNKDDKVASLPLPNDTAMTQAIMKRMGTAYIGVGQSAQTMFSGYKKAITDYYAAKAFAMGKLNSSGDKTLVNSDLMDEAFNAVTGGLAEWQGHSTFVPWGMDKNDFNKQIPYKIQETIDQLKLGTNWRAYDLMPLDKNGRYQLLLQGRPVTNGYVDFN